MDDGNTTNISCEQELLTGTTTLRSETEEILRYFLTGFLFVIFPFALIINTDLLVLIIRSKRLHQITFYLAFQVVVVDLLTTVLIYPVTITSAIAGQWVMGLELCWITAYSQSLLRQGRNWMMLVFVLDRFLVVFRPLRYPKVRGRVTVIASVICWVWVLLISSVAHFSGCYNFNRVTWACRIGMGCIKRGHICRLGELPGIFLTDIFGSYLPMALYIIIFIKVRKIRKTTVIPSGGDCGDEIYKKQRRELKTLRTFFLLFLSVFGVRIWPFLVFAVGFFAYNQTNTDPPDWFVILSYAVRTIFHILPIVDGLAIQRHSDVRASRQSCWKGRSLE